MTTPSDRTIAPAGTIRMIHGAMVAGVILFAAVSHFVLRPTMAASGSLSPMVFRTLLGVVIGACGLSLVLRQMVPKRSTDESPDLFWTRAASRALTMWVPLEGACLLSVFLYARTDTTAPLAFAGAAVLLFIGLNPWHLEKR